MGSLEGSPYVAQLDEKTIAPTPTSTIASSSEREFVQLFAKYFRGCSIDSPT
jgi:hypothetical protein